MLFISGLFAVTRSNGDQPTKVQGDGDAKPEQTVRVSCFNVKRMFYIYNSLCWPQRVCNHVPVVLAGIRCSQVVPERSRRCLCGAAVHEGSHAAEEVSADGVLAYVHFAVLKL